MNGHAFALRLPGETYPWLASVMGTGEMEFGLSITRGPQAVQHMATTLSADTETGDHEAIDILGFTVDCLSKIPPEMRGLIEKAKFSARRETLVPFFAVKEPCCRLRTINLREAELMLYALTGILHSLASGTFMPGLFLPGNKLLTLTVTGDLSQLKVTVGHEDFDIPSPDRAANITEPEDPDYVPASDDLDGWKVVDLRTTRRIVRIVTQEELIGQKTMEQYFGPVQKSNHEPPSGISQGSYMDWLGCCYRPGRGKPTIAERLLQEELPQADRLLMEARAKSVPTFCRTLGVEGECAAQLADIFTGERFAAHDRLLAEGIRRCAGFEMILPVRHYRAGDFTFVAGAGENFPATWLPQALDFLAEHGLKPTKQGFDKKSHLLGRLFLWHEQMAQAPRPTLCNTDREPLEWHKASYAVLDEMALRRALADQRDIEPEDDRDHFTWFRQDKKSSQRTLLGRIELIGGEMLTETNSAERHDRLRQLLEKAPGVRLVTVSKKSIAEMADSQPLDDEMNPPVPMEITSEIAAELNAQMLEQYLDWLDQPLPMLAGKTPRQASRTKSGAVKVAALIRGIPAPMLGNDSTGVDVPRAQMLRELGLE